MLPRPGFRAAILSPAYPTFHSRWRIKFGSQFKLALSCKIYWTLLSVIEDTQSYSFSYWMLNFLTELVEDVSNIWSRRRWMGNGFEWWKRGWRLDWARSWLGRDSYLPWDSHGPMPAQVSTENSFHRGVLVTYQKFCKCTGTWKNCFKILIKKGSRAPYLFLQNTPRTEYWRIWKSWALMFGSYLLIPNCSFCGKRLKNKNKKYVAV